MGHENGTVGINMGHSLRPSLLEDIYSDVNTESDRNR